MGVLTVGEPLSWDDAAPHRPYVKKHGILQFIEVWKKNKDVHLPLEKCLLWGDEVEYMLVSVHPASQDSAPSSSAPRAQLLLAAPRLLEALAAKQAECVVGPDSVGMIWHPEYASYMLEGTPERPLGPSLDEVRLIESSMRERRLAVEQLLQPGQYLLNLSTFPRMGCPQFAINDPASGKEPLSLEPNPLSGPSLSHFIPDAIISPHPRFATLTANIRTRRGSKVNIQSPLYRDQSTLQMVQSLPSPSASSSLQQSSLLPLSQQEEIHNTLALVPSTSFTQPPRPLSLTDTHGSNTPVSSDSLPNVYMDAMAFGMGNCCLQCTFQTPSLDDARYLYDQFAVLSPLFLALTAATPFLNGFLVDSDVRWDTISAAVDDRKPEEADPSSSHFLPKSRYASISRYISRECPGEANDVFAPRDEESYRTLIEAGVDEPLAAHVAHLFIRDPLVIFRGKIDEISDEDHSDHFENVQSTNWQSVRFKPPPAGSSIGWRTEFRVMETQITDYENAAFTSLIVLISRMILSRSVPQWYMPLSLVDENMARAHVRDAVRTQRFFWPVASSRSSSHGSPSSSSSSSSSCTELSLDQILNGSDDHSWTGLFPMIRSFLGEQQLSGAISSATFSMMNEYVQLAANRASGRLVTTANYLRSIVASHPDYLKDSRISESVNAHIVQVCDNINHGLLRPIELLGTLPN